MSDEEGIQRGILKDLEIDASTMFENPKGFIDQCMKSVAWLDSELDKTNNQTDLVSSFKNKALENKDAQDKASEAFSKIYAIMASLDGESIACLIPKLAETLQLGNNMVTTFAVAEIGGQHFSKYQLFQMRKELKKAYEQAIAVLKGFFPERLPKIVPVIIGKSGNYKESSGIKMYKFRIKNEEFISPYAVAKILGIEIRDYVELLELLASDPEKYGHIELVAF